MPPNSSQTVRRVQKKAESFDSASNVPARGTSGREGLEVGFPQ